MSSQGDCKNCHGTHPEGGTGWATEGRDGPHDPGSIGQVCLGAGGVLNLATVAQGMKMEPGLWAAEYFRLKEVHDELEKEVERLKKRPVLGGPIGGVDMVIYDGDDEG